MGAKRLSERWFGCETSFWNMVWVRNVFLKYGLGAKRLSKIWFGCETSFWNMVWVRNVFLNYGDGGETSFLFMGRGRNVFLRYELEAKRLTKKWCKLTMGRKVCVPGGWVMSDRSEFLSDFWIFLTWQDTLGHHYELLDHILASDNKKSMISAVSRWQYTSFVTKPAFEIVLLLTVVIHAYSLQGWSHGTSTTLNTDCFKPLVLFKADVN